MDKLLEVKGLKKYFNVTKGFFKNTVGYVKAVDGIDLFIEKGKTLGLVGESGCGKTTVGKLILRLIPADEGEILFKGKDILTVSKNELLGYRKYIQIVFQDPYGSLNPRMTVEELIREPMLKHKTIARKDARVRVSELLSMVGMNPDDMRKYPHEFSGGQRQRIVVARALSLNPELIICDEPVSALDVSVQAQVLNLLEDLQEQFNISYLFIAHGMPVIKHISDRVAVMYMGKLVEIAEATEIFQHYIHPYTKILMSAVPIPDPTIDKHRIIMSGEVPNPINIPDGCRFHLNCPSCMERCKHDEPILKEISPGHMLACHLV